MDLILQKLTELGISKIIGISPEAVRKRMQKGRELLKTEIERWGNGYDK